MKIWKKALLCAFGLALWGLLSWVTGTICGFQATIGVPCPGCGSSRAAIALLNGDFVGAMYWHPLIILSLVLLPVLGLRYTVFAAKLVKKGETVLLAAIAAAYVGVFIVRMITRFPHSPPMVIYDNAIYLQLFRFLRSLIM